MTDWDAAAQRLEDHMAKRPVAGPYLLKADDYPLTVAVFVASDPDRLVWAQSVLKPTHGLLRALDIPPVAQWVGEPVDAAVMAPREWPERWTTCA
jgi:hypothetical protein